ncbi:MAG: hypothetical protein HRT45_05090 [Bdellovibrionales bacterium]|nr:hypothetical protein [Bdellovibrionales bacterium]
MRGLVGAALIVAGFSYWIYFYSQVLKLRKSLRGKGLGLSNGIPWVGLLLMGVGIAVFFQPYFLSHIWVSALVSAPVISLAILVGAPRGFHVTGELKLISDKIRAEAQNSKAVRGTSGRLVQQQSPTSIPIHIFVALLLFFMLMLEELPYVDENYSLIDAANEAAVFSVGATVFVYVIDAVAGFLGFQEE